MEFVLEILKSGTIRRWAIGIIGSVLLALNNKFGLGMDQTTIVTIGGVIMSLVLGSNYKEAKIAGEAAAAKVGSDAAAVAVLKGVNP